jgi:ABC-type Fe3+-hydroxamate transport system substrate-binding protein
MIKSDSSAFAKPAKKKPLLTSGGLSTNALTQDEVLEKIRQINPDHFYVWNSHDLEDQPLTPEQLAQLGSDQH